MKRALLLLLLTGCGTPPAPHGGIAPHAAIDESNALPVADANDDQNGMEMAFVAGSIYFNGTNWSITSDAVHRPINIRRVDTFEDHAELYFNFYADEIVLFMVTPDESYAKAGITAGASVGQDVAVISYGKNGQRLMTSEMAVQYSNFFVYGIFKVRKQP